MILWQKATDFCRLSQFHRFFASYVFCHHSVLMPRQNSPPMKIYSLLFAFLILHSSFGILSAAPPPELTVLRTQYDKVLSERVTAPFDTSKGQLDAKFIGALDRAIGEAKQAGDLKGVLSIEAEKKRLADKLPIPAEDDESTPAALKKLRPIYREQLKRLEEQRTANHAAILPGYTAKLQVLEARLTKADRVEEAKEVMTYREGLKVVEGSGSAVAAAPPAFSPPKGGEKPTLTSSAAGPRLSKAERAANARRLVEWAVANGHDVLVNASGQKQALRLRAGDAVPKGDLELLEIERPNGTPPVAEPPPWEAFTGQDAVREVYLADWKQTVPAGSLAALSGLSSLGYFQFASNVDGPIAESLPEFPALRTLMLKPTPAMSGADIAILTKKYPNVETFLLNGAALSDEEFATLGRWKDLGFLMFDGPSSVLTPSKVQTLATLPKLREMRFYGPQPNALDSGAMATLTNLRRIDFSYNATSENIKAACAAPGLEALELSRIKTLSDVDLEDISTHPSLTTLCINNSEKITDAGLAHVLKMEGLVELQCTGTPGISAAAFESLGVLKALRKLVVHQTVFDDAALKAVGKIRSLKELGINKTAVTEDALKVFKKARPDVTIGR